tara:strand:+ start:1186 stop:2541 length:1356 start_codon:yes stop_codon:yes gene_type:complete
MTNSNLMKNPDNPDNPVIRFIGIGGTGVNLVEKLAMIGLQGVESHSVDTDNRSLSNCHQSKTLLLGKAIPCGLGAGGDVALARAAVESDRDHLLRLVSCADLVFVIAGMGGGTGTEAASFVARLAKEAGALVVGVAATPFNCEGSRRGNKAAGGIRDLKQSADIVFHFSNEEVMHITGTEISLNNALEIANRHLCESVLGLSRMLIEPGLLNVSFSDLRDSMTGRHSLGSTLCVEGVGENLAADAMGKILSHPSARMGKALSEATTLLVHLSGGDNLSLAEINTFVESISSHAPDIDLVIGASGTGSNNVLQVILIIVQKSNSKASLIQTNLSKNLTENETLDLNYPENFISSGENSYIGLGAESKGANRVRFAYTPPAPTVETITPEMKDNLLEAAAKQEPNRKKRKEIKQEMLPLEIISKGRFEKIEPTIHKGEDLDQPTYIRRGRMLN